MHEKIVECLYVAIDDTNAQHSGELPIEKSVDTPLYGSSSMLDSLGLVNFIVAAEQRIEASFGIPLVLADDRALEQEPSPFESVGALAQYIEVLLRERE